MMRRVSKSQTDRQTDGGINDRQIYERVDLYGIIS